VQARRFNYNSTTDPPAKRERRRYGIRKGNSAE
jgi:hypothetical protein